MTTTMSEKELEKKLLEAGNQLLSPPSTASELLSVLSRVEELLSSVEQSPSESMRESLSPSTRALITENLLRHADVDVKVAVASCISEITRITAPDAPYDDERMKEVFQLIVSSFEKLDDTNSPSYTRRVAILETVAKVRSCVVMLDLECDGLIIEMFQHFFRSIRDNHPEIVFFSMETIMTLVLEESEDISSELLSTILDVLKKGNKDVLPNARELGEKVLGKCASKLKRCLLSALSSSGTSFDDYSKAVTDVCQSGNETVEPCDGDTASKNLADESEAVDEPFEKAVEVAMETMDDAPPSDEVGPSTVGSPKSVMSNGTLKKEIEDTSVVNDNPKESDHLIHGEEAEPRKTDVGVDAEEPAKSQTKPGKPNRRKGRKPNSSKCPSVPVLFDSKTEDVEEPEHEVNDVKVVGNRDPVADIAEQAAKERTEVPVSSPKASDNELVDAPSSPSSSLGIEAHLKKLGRSKKKDDSMQDDVTTSDVNSKNESNAKKEFDNKKASEEVTVSVSKSNKRTDKKPSSVPDEEESVLRLASDKKKDAENTVEVDANSDKDSDKKAELGGSQREVKKQRSKTETPVKDNAKAPSKDEKKRSAASSKSIPKSAKSDSDVEKASKSSSKRKYSGEQQATDTKDYGSELINSVVKVWWPDDKKYYKGVVSFYDSDQKKHKVLYDDGDIEVLNLKEEKWLLVSGPLPSQGQSNDGKSDDESADDMPKGKKAKTSPDQGAKQGKTVTSAKKSGASSSKSNATSKSGSRQKEVGKPTDEVSKNVGKSGGKSKGSKSWNKLVDRTPKYTGKSKDDTDTPKTKKSKQDTAKGAAKSKGKSHKSSGKVNAGTSGKVDTDSSEEEETEDEMSPEPAETPEISKGKSHTPKTKKSKQDTAKGAAKSKGKSHKSSGKINSGTSGKVDTDSSEEEKTEDEQSTKPAETLEIFKGKSQSTSKSQKNSRKRKGSVKG